MPYCTECGHQNPHGARFCSNCGHRMPGERPGDSTSTLHLGGPDRADSEEDVVPLAEGTLRIAYNTLRPAALLIGQRILGAKTFEN